MNGIGRLHPTCAGCGADFTEPGSLSLDGEERQWGETTGHLINDGAEIVVNENGGTAVFPAWQLELSCSDCGDQPMEAP